MSVDELLNADIDINNDTYIKQNKVELDEPDIKSQYGYIEFAEESQNKKAKFKFSNKRTRSIIKSAVVLLLVAALIIGIFTVVVPFVKDRLAFNKGLDLLKNGEYLKAAAIFNEIDSSEARENYYKCYHEYSKELYEKGDYESAIAQLEIDGVLSYEGSQDLYNKYRYEYALYNVKHENYPKAIELFTALGEYNGSADKLDELYFTYGCVLYNEEDYEGAVEYLEKTTWRISDYHTRARYGYAVQLFDEGQYGLAYNQFNALVKAGAENYYNTGVITRNLLWNILLYGAMWTKDQPVTNGNATADISYSFTSSKVSVALRDKSTGNTINTLSYDAAFYVPTQAFRDAGINETFVGGVDSSGAFFFTFDFYSNNRLKMHYNEHTGTCESIICGDYTVDSAIAEEADSLLNFALGNEKLDYHFEEIDVPVVSFINEFPEEKKEVTDTPQNKNPDVSAGDNTVDPGVSSSVSSSSNSSVSSSASSNNTTSGHSSPNGSSSSKTPSKNTSTTTSTKTSTTTSANTSTTSTTTSTTTSKPTQSTSSSSSANTGTTSKDKCADGHTWHAITSLVHHDEVGHYEQVTKSKKVTKYKCAVCYEKYSSLDKYYEHFKKHEASSDPMVSIFKERYETVEDWEPYYVQEWVVDIAEYDEVVTTGYKCSVCGKTK